MHELSIVENIIKIIKKDYKCIEKEIRSISVSVGELTGIVPENLIYLFDSVKRDYELNEVELKVTVSKCKIVCEDCGCNKEDYSLDSSQKCEFCGSDKLKMIGGGDLTLLSIEIPD